MRLAVLMPVASPWARGACLDLARLGADVHAIDFAVSAPGYYLSPQDQSQTDEVRGLNARLGGTHFLGTRAPGRLRHFVAVPEFRRLLAKLRPDRLLTLYGGGFANLAWLSGFRPYVVYVVGSDVLLSGPIRGTLSSYAFRSAARVLANGRYLAARTRELQPSARVEPLYIGVDTDELIPGPAAPGSRIVCTRGFLPVYNNGYLVQGLAALDDRAPKDLEVIFAASGPELPEVQQLADRILPPSVRTRIQFRNGLNRRELIGELQRSHVYVSLSRSDGTSFSLLEAMACGLFPVLSDLPQNREWVTPEENNGILVPFDQPEVLAGALQRALTDPNWRARTAEYNRQKVVERASLPRNMAALLHILEHVDGDERR